MELWTKEHVTSFLLPLAVMLLLTLLLRHFLSSKSLRTRMIPFQVLSMILVLLEIGKQTLSFRRGYDLYHIPLHFCSLFIFMLPLASFYRGKYQQKVQAITCGLCASVTALMLIYPNLIYSAGNVQGFFTDFFDFHTVAFHNLVVLAFLLIVGLNLYAPGQKGENKAVILFIVCYCVIAATMAQVLQTNYNNFYRCNIPPLEAVRASVEAAAGYAPAQCLYVAIVTVVDILFVLGFFRLYCLLQKLAPAKADT